MLAYVLIALTGLQLWRQGDSFLVDDDHHFLNTGAKLVFGFQLKFSAIFFNWPQLALENSVFGVAVWYKIDKCMVSYKNDIFFQN